MNKNKIYWIFGVIFVIGLITSMFFITTQTNLIKKNDNFDIKLVFETKTEGDVGYVILKRNYQTQSILDWAKFEDTGKLYTYFSEDKVIKYINVALPSNVEKGTYYIDVEIIYMSDKKETKTIEFDV